MCAILIIYDTLLLHHIMMPGAKSLNPHELAHKWMKDLEPRPNMSSGMVIPRYANDWEDCGSAEHETICRHHNQGFHLNITGYH